MKRTLALVLATALIAVMAVGCGSSGPKKVIKLAHRYTDDAAGGMTNTAGYAWVVAAKKKFEATYKNYEVQLEYLPGSDMQTKLMADFKAGISHDVIMSQSAEVPQHVALGSLLDAASEERARELVGEIADPAGSFYRFSMSSSTMKVRR